jgi:AbrB family looped-hinge helix DNA binding protein
MAEEPEITTVSEKGQVVIPQELRRQLGIKPKSKFLIFGRGDTIIMKRLQLPDVKQEWEKLFKAIDKKGLKITEEKIREEVQKYRRDKRKRK